MPVAVSFSPFPSLKGCEGFGSSLKMLPRRPLPAPPAPCQSSEQGKPYLPVRPLPSIPSTSPKKRSEPAKAPLVSKLPSPVSTHRKSGKQSQMQQEQKEHRHQRRRQQQQLQQQQQQQQQKLPKQAPPTPIRPLLLPTPPPSPEPFKPTLPSRAQFIKSIQPISTSSVPSGSRCPLCYTPYRASIVRREPPVMLSCGNHVGRDCLLRYVNRVEPSGRYSNMCPLPSCTDLHDLYAPSFAMMPVIVVTEPDDVQDGTYMFDEWVCLGEIEESCLRNQLFEAWETVLRVRTKDIHLDLGEVGLEERRVMEEVLFTLTTTLILMIGSNFLGRDVFRALVKDVWQALHTMTAIPNDEEPWEWVLLLCRLVVTQFILQEYPEENDSSTDAF